MIWVAREPIRRPLAPPLAMVPRQRAAHQRSPDPKSHQPPWTRSIFASRRIASGSMDSDPQPSTGAKGWPIHYWQPGLDLKPVLDALADDIGIEALIEGFEMVRPNKLPPASN